MDFPGAHTGAGPRLHHPTRPSHPRILAHHQCSGVHVCHSFFHSVPFADYTLCIGFQARDAEPSRTPRPGAHGTRRLVGRQRHGDGPSCGRETLRVLYQHGQAPVRPLPAPVWARTTACQALLHTLSDLASSAAVTWGSVWSFRLGVERCPTPASLTAQTLSPSTPSTRPLACRLLL